MKKIHHLYGSNATNDWLLTQIGGWWSFWCFIFHSKNHEYRDESRFFRKHRCTKCGTVFMSPYFDNI